MSAVAVRVGSLSGVELRLRGAPDEVAAVVEALKATPRIRVAVGATKPMREDPDRVHVYGRIAPSSAPPAAPSPRAGGAAR